MGMNLIGYLIIAPKTLTDAQKAASLERLTDLTTRVSAFQEAREALEADTGDEPLPSALLEQRAQLLRDLGWSFETTVDGDADEQTAYDQDDALEQIAGIKTNNFLDDLEQFLEGNARDTAWRHHPDNDAEMMLFCGGPSWGDEPDGLGYGMMKTITLLKLEAILGIR